MNDPQIRRVGPWTLHEKLGQGGNSTVWKATRSDADAAVALKLINAKKVGKEPYQRFVREIAFLRDHQETPGVLPLLDAHLPENPTTDDRPWLAMPIATPIAQALSGKPLSEVVGAVAVIAGTLARLQSEADIAHRDIKPGNLYELDGAWMIGDFGLVALPDAAGLTLENRPLGPAHYTAYEMILHPATVDPHPADVYSLGKTLWVLATDQRFPPEGHQPAGTRAFEVGDFRPHPKSAVLDQEIDLMTRLHPDERPSKEQVARDLALWGDLANKPVALDVSEARVRFRARMQAQLASEDILEQQKELALAAVRLLQALTKPLNEALKSIYPGTKVDQMGDRLTSNTLGTRTSLPRDWEVVFRWNRCTLVAPLDRPASPALRMSRCVELLNDGRLVLHLMVDVGLEGVMATFFNWRSELYTAPVGSVEAEKMFQDGVAELAAELTKGIDMLLEHLEADQD